MSLKKPLEGMNFGLAFWQFRYQAYTGAEPHPGYKIILDWIASKAQEGDANKHSRGFSFTSNIDSHWMRSGLDEMQLLEVHGSIGFTQCAGVPEPLDLDALGVVSKVRTLSQKPSACASDIWPARSEEWQMKIDPASDVALPPFPKCKHCGSLSRPNVLMFGDWEVCLTFCSIQPSA